MGQPDLSVFAQTECWQSISCPQVPCPSSPKGNPLLDNLRVTPIIMSGVVNWSALTDMMENFDLDV